MLDFQKPKIEDIKWVAPMVEHCGQIGCDISFATTYLWRNEYDIRICKHNDVYYKAYFTKGNVYGYAFPIGSGNIKNAVDVILQDAKERCVLPMIGMLNETNAELLNRLYPNYFEFTEERDSADYIYSRESLADLPGKKYHAKRNHISKFKRNYEDFCYKSLNSSNFSDAFYVASCWQERSNINNGKELDAIKEALDNFDRLSLFGGVLYVNNSPVAMTIASQINQKVCDVNFEKAIDIDEAYAVINNEFAKAQSGYIYFNREEDMGIEGLRKSKLSYNPEFLVNKYTAKVKLP